jgi:hypothetical protein
VSDNNNKADEIVIKTSGGKKILAKVLEEIPPDIVERIAHTLFAAEAVKIGYCLERKDGEDECKIASQVNAYFSHMVNLWENGKIDVW